MKSLYLDCYSGVAGDMILASLLDLDVDRTLWLESLQSLAVEGFTVSFKRTARHGISALQISIKVKTEQPHRKLDDIVEIIKKSGFSNEVKENSIEIFTNLAKAEAKVHNCDINKVHFHEVGAVDAIVDIVGICLAIESLGVKKIYSSPIGLGRGVSKCDHGPMPLPPPATLELLEGCSIHFHDIDTELSTPTGAAVLKTLASFEPVPDDCVLGKTGYGAGSKSLQDIPNVVRAIMLEPTPDFVADRAVLIETNIDDMNPEIYPHVIKKLLKIGAMDAFLAPIIMKKGRPGNVLSVLCPAELERSVVDTIYEETSTLGIRISKVKRLKLPRREIKVKTEWGTIRGKEAKWKGKVRRTPEFEDCKRVAESENVSLQEVYHAFFTALSERDS